MKISKSLFLIFALVCLISFCISGCKKENPLGEIELIPVKVGELYQYITSDAKVAINPQFTEASLFRDGIAVVKSSGENPQFGYIGEDGKYIILPTFYEATIFNNGLAWVVSKNGFPSCINTKGEILFSLPDANEVRCYVDNLAAFSKINKEGKKLWGFINEDGKIVIEPQFEDAHFFSEGLCPVSNSENKWGYIKENGKLVINFQFDFATPFTNGKAKVKSKDFYGLIETSGNFIIKPIYDDVYPDGDLIAFAKDKKYGWLEVSGKTHINPQFDMIRLFNNNKRTSVQIDDKWGIIDNNGNYIVKPQYDEAMQINDKIGYVKTNNKYRLIDSEGNFIDTTEYEEILRENYQLFSVKNDHLDMKNIIKHMNLYNPEGLHFSSTYNEIIKNLNLSKEAFTKGNICNIIKKTHITNGYNVHLYTVGSPWLEHKIHSDTIFSGKLSPGGYLYEIKCEYNPEKAEQIKDAIEKSLPNITQNESDTDSDKSIYYNDQTRYTIWKNYSSVFVLIESSKSKTNLAILDLQ